MTFQTDRDETSSSPEMRISGRVIAAARALAGISPTDFAAACGVPVATLTRAETGGGALIQEAETIAALKRGLDHFGLLIVEESDGMGAGVRLKFTRLDALQIARLEGEGGAIGADDAP